nr:BatD family protein [Shewanella litorisediminis]
MDRIEATVDKNPVGRDESLVLTVIADDEVEANRLDTSALLRNFLVGRTSVSRSTRIINFNSEKETRWQVLLTPRTTGTLTIPSFTIDGVSSAPIRVEVSEQDQVNRDAQYLYIEGELLTPSVYVGQLALYKVKLYLGLDLQRGELSAPQMAGAQIKQLGEDKDGSEIVDGRRFRVIERMYGIIPDKSGSLTLQAPVFEGDVLVPAPRNGGMFNFNESRPMRTTGKNTAIEVLDKPEGWQGHWLVANLVALKEEFPQDIEEFAVGTPITRSITLLASNADETSLPSLNLPLPAELKSYPEKPEIKSFVREGQLVAQLRLTQAIVPTEVGTFELPAIEVPWWNPHLKRREIASIPGRTIRVTGPAPAAPVPTISEATAPTASYWPWLTAFLALGWLATALGWAMSVKRAPASLVPTPSQPQGVSQLKQQLADACRGSDGSAMLSAAADYLSARYGTNITLDKARTLSEPLGKALGQIQRARFGQHGTGNEAPDGASLIAAIEALETKTNTSTAASLGDLNP